MRTKELLLLKVYPFKGIKILGLLKHFISCFLSFLSFSLSLGDGPI